ncbi:putative cytochrome P450 4e1, partial [Bienertia sinuspersici]
KKHKWEDLCAFRVFPYKCQTYFQLAELDDDHIQKEIQKPPLLTVCTCSTGWFTSYALDSLRLRVAVRFISVYPQQGAESLLKSVSERFEKSKKMRLQVNSLKPGEEGESQDGEEADFTLQNDLGTENISRNYLQELFESFPSTGAPNQQLDADIGEYQIYEQDSDENYSDH